MNAFKKLVSSLAVAALLVTMVPATAFATVGSTQDPDLVVTNVWIDNMVLGFTAANQGLSDADLASAGFTEVYVDGVLIRTYEWEAHTEIERSFLLSGDEYSFYPEVLTGTHTAQVCIDTTDVVMEANEDNNCLEMVVTDDVDSPDVTTGDNDVTGGVDVSTGVTAETGLTVDGDIDTTGSATLDTGSADVDTTEDGTTDMDTTVLVDTGTVEIEDEEEIYPDLVLQDIYLDGNILTIQAGNEGNEDVESDAEGSTYIYIDDLSVPLWTYSWSTLDDVSFLEAGHSSIIQPQTLAPGYHDIKACVDAGWDVDELVETNNCMELDLKVDSEETLSGIDLRIASAGVESDDDTHFYGEFCNDGDTWADDIVVTFTVNGYTNELSYPSGLGAEVCVTLYSWGFTSFGVEDGETYDLVVTLTDRDQTVTYETSVTIPEDEVTASIGEFVEEYVIEEVVTEDETETIADDEFTAEVFAQFEELWTDTDYPDVMYLGVYWGYFEDDSPEVTEWDGEVNFEGSLVGKPWYKVGFEPEQDWIDLDNLNPTMTPFVSDIYGGKDGIVFKLKGNLDDDPFVEFNSAFENTSLEVFLNEIDGTYEYDYGNGYKVIFQLETHEQWMNRFEDTALLQVRVGNLDGEGSSGDEDHFYSVNMYTSEGSIVRGYLPVLLENHKGDFSGYDELTRNADKDQLTLEAGIFGHQDGYLSLLALTDSDVGDRYVMITVTDDETGDVVFDNTFTQDEELGVFELDDGTGNQISIKNMFRYKSHLINNADAVFNAMHSWMNGVERLAAVIESLNDTGALDEETEAALNAMLEELLEVTPGVDGDADLGYLQSEINDLLSKFFLLWKRYDRGTINVDNLDSLVTAAYDSAGDDLGTKLDTLAASSGLMTDVDYDAWYGKFMDDAIGKGFFGGFKDHKGNALGVMKPGESITRFQLIKVMSELAYQLEVGLGETACDPATVTHTSATDWMEDHWARGYVQCIENSGMELTLLEEVINEDLENGTSPAARWEVVQLVFEILGADFDDASSYSLDDLESSDLDSETLSMIETAFRLKIISGYPDGTFKGKFTVNRAEMFKIVMLSYEVFSL